MSSGGFYSLVDRIEAQAKQTIREPATYKITGIAPLINAAQQSLIDTQIRSFTLAAGLILVLIGLFMKSFKALVAAVLPNLAPILSVFGVMVIFGIAIDAATVMIASIAIGIAADDTIHFLAHYRTEKLNGLDTLSAVGNTLEKAGRAITCTSVVTTAGFVIMLLADFQPIQYFGLFAGITMIMAWVGDVFILPACVADLRLWDRKPPTQRP